MIYLLSSLSILLICALFVGIEINRGIKRGFRKTLISLSGVIFSIIVGIFAARYLSGILSRYILNFMKRFIFRSVLVGGSVNMDNIASILVQAILSSVLFVVAFLIIRLIFALVIRIILKRRRVNVTVEHSRHDRTSEQKKERMRSIIAGGLCGVIVTAAITSPILGAFDVVHSAVGIVDGTEVNLWKAFKLSETQIKSADRYSRNFPSILVYSMGGKMIYTASATATVGGEMVSVPKEMRVMESNMDTVKSVISIFSRDTKLSPDDIKALEDVCAFAEESAIFRYMLAEFIQQGTASWLNSSSFMAVPTPRVSASFESLFREILRICSGTSSDTVANDVKTLVNIYGHIVETAEHASIIDAIVNSDIMMNINNELRENSRMNGVMIRNELYDILIVSMTARMALNNPNSQNLNSYVSFMENMARSANSALENATLTRDQMIAQLANEAAMHCEEMGHTFSHSALMLVSEAIIDNFTNSEEPVSVAGMVTFFGGSVIEDIEGADQVGPIVDNIENVGDVIEDIDDIEDVENIDDIVVG